MPPRYLAAVSCPACGVQYQTPIEQILDVRVDPSVRDRILSGGVNVAVCPSCGAGGTLGVPFIYHDPEREVALLYLPATSGSNEIERQQAAGRLARQLMDSMPPEERKGYLLQPETFIAMDTLIKRVLELEGVTEEDLLRSQRQRELVGQMLQAEEDALPGLVAENQDLIDEGMFTLMEYLVQLAGMQGASATDRERVEAVRRSLLEQTELGRRLHKRSQILEAFADDPSRASLVEALVDAREDEQTVELLVQMGMSLLDYGFFQLLLKRIDNAATAEEKEQLTALRRTVLRIRDEMAAASQDVTKRRADLVAKLLASEDPVRMVNSHLSEFDNLFFMVLGMQLQQAEQQKDQETLKQLQRIARVVSQTLEAHMPPEMALARRLMMVPEEELPAVLKQNREHLTPRFAQLLEALEATSREQGEAEAAERLQKIRELVEPMIPAQAQEAAPSRAPEPQAAAQPDEGEARTPSGLIIAKR